MSKHQMNPFIQGMIRRDDSDDSLLHVEYKKKTKNFKRTTIYGANIWLRQL